ncbi:MAG TPA: DUF1648 domain-containing protein [Candidatus Acidoferrales bacterium]|jgi:uncharacterized membrane protein|nr:DUF1648 domain-containing protein [Candidatus Acidoferrales bacterium]
MDETGRPFDYAAAAGNAILLGIGIWGYLTLPGTIPTHFGLDGRAATWGPSWTILMLPLVSTFGAAAVWFFNKIGLRARLPFYVPDDRRDAVNAIARQMNSALLLVLAAFFIVMELEIIGAARDSATSLLILPTVAALLICVLTLLGAYMTKMYRAAR